MVFSGLRFVNGVSNTVERSRAASSRHRHQTEWFRAIDPAGATIAVVQGMAVDLQDRLTTAVNSSATVRLASEITLTLAAHTNLTFNQNVTTGGTGRTRLNLFEGGLRSLVPPLLRTESFEIHTPNAITAVRGTDFDTTYIEGVVRPGDEGCQRYTKSGCAKG